MKNFILMSLLCVNLQAAKINIYGSYGAQMIMPRNNALVNNQTNPSIDTLSLPLNEIIGVPSMDAGIEIEKGRFGFGLGLKIIGSWEYKMNTLYKNDIGMTDYKGNVTTIGGFASVYYKALENTTIEYRFGRGYSTGSLDFRYEDLHGRYSSSSNKIYSTDYFQEFVIKQYYMINKDNDLAVGLEAGYLMMSLDPVIEQGAVSTNLPTPLPNQFGPPAKKTPKQSMPFTLSQDSFSLKLSVKKYFTF